MNRMIIPSPARSEPPSPSTSRANAKARTRARVLQAARSLFMERGYEAATIRDIASRADLSTGAVFASFSDKADLFKAVLAEDHERQLDAMESARLDDLPVRKALLAMFRVAYQFHLDQLPLLRAATGLS